jgi:hypothetical protein
VGITSFDHNLDKNLSHRVEYSANFDVQVGKHRRCRRHIARKDAVFGVLSVTQREHGNRFGLWVDNPVLRYTGLCIFFPFRDQISNAIFSAITDDLYDQIGSVPKPVVAARISCGAQQDQSGLSEFARTQANAQGSNVYLAPD